MKVRWNATHFGWYYGCRRAASSSISAWSTANSFHDLQSSRPAFLLWKPPNYNPFCDHFYRLASWWMTRMAYQAAIAGIAGRPRASTHNRQVEYSLMLVRAFVNRTLSKIHATLTWSELYYCTCCLYSFDFLWMDKQRVFIVLTRRHTITHYDSHLPSFQMAAPPRPYNTYRYSDCICLTLSLGKGMVVGRRAKTAWYMYHGHRLLFWVRRQTWEGSCNLTWYRRAPRWSHFQPNLYSMWY